MIKFDSICIPRSSLCVLFSLKISWPPIGKRFLYPCRFQGSSQVPFAITPFGLTLPMFILVLCFRNRLRFVSKWENEGTCFPLRYSSVYLLVSPTRSLVSIGWHMTSRRNLPRWVVLSLIDYQLMTLWTTDGRMALVRQLWARRRQ